MKHSLRTYLLAMLPFALPAAAQTGRSAYDFLNIPTSSHVFGLGGTNIALIDDDVSLAGQNPALIGPEIDRQLAFSYMHYWAALTLPACVLERRQAKGAPGQPG